MSEWNLVDVSEFGILGEPRYFRNGWTKENRILGRDSAVQALVRAQSALPRGMKFKVWDFQRPLDVQLAMIESFRQRIKAAHPDWPEDRIMQEVYVFASKPLPDVEVTRPDCHRNGGAVDLTVLDAQGNELDMGTDHDDLTQRAASLFFEQLERPIAEDLLIRDNRRILRAAMESAGWEMLASEWWHWSTSE